MHVVHSVDFGGFYLISVAMMNRVALPCLFIHELFMIVCILFREEVGGHAMMAFCVHGVQLFQGARGGGELCAH